jgi:ribosomal protein S17E
MGRIKSKLVKRTSHTLMKEESRFTGSFESNKKILDGLTPSKKVRNMIAGYIARLKRREESKIQA